MGKKNAGSAAAKAAKKAKAQMKVERKEKKKVMKETGGGGGGGKGAFAQSGQGKGKSGGKGAKGGKGKNDEDSDDDLEGILEKMRKEWEESHKVTEELVEGPPSKRANATLTACPNGNHLWCVGGEYFSEDGKAHFYNDTFRYAPDKDEWRMFVSPTCPGPRSAHAVAATPASGGKLFLFGGEFSSLHQTTFHHYGDFWSFDIGTHSWDRIETKIRPSARSGHRMAVWKHFVVLFGGFYDPGITTRYLNDLWIFDTQEYTWKQIEFKETELRPSPRSGFSFLPCPEGILLHGGYCKQYAKGKRPVGVMLEDTWLLKLSIPETPTTPITTSSSKFKDKAPPPPTSAKGNKGGWGAKGNPGQHMNITAKWERRKRPSDAYAPSLRSGCTMGVWGNKGMGILFGGVTDEDTSEEVLESVFHNDLYGYQISGKGRWVSLNLKVPKAKGGKKKKDKKAQAKKDDSDEEDEGGLQPQTPQTPIQAQPQPNQGQQGQGEDDPVLSTPSPRYNAMLAVLRNTLYIYGGIIEKGSKEYTLDDFYALALDKLDRYACLRKLSFEIPSGEVESSSSDDDEDDDDDSDDSDEDYVDDEIYSDMDGEGEVGLGEGSGEEEDHDEEGGGSEKTKPKKRKVREEGEDDERGSEGDTEGGNEDEDGSSSKKSKRKTTEKKKRGKKKHDEDISDKDGEDEVEGTGGGEGAGGKDDGTAEQEQENNSALRTQAASFLTSSKDLAARSEEEKLSTPLPGETLALFFARSRDYWTQKAASLDRVGENRGKELRRVGFGLAEERYEEYKPLLQEVEKILTEAGLNEEEMRLSSQGAGAGAGGVGGMSRNRR